MENSSGPGAEERLDKLEKQVGQALERLDLLFNLVEGLAKSAYGQVGAPGRASDTAGEGSVGGAWKSAMPAFTTKQHVVLQMLTRGARNDEIAERMRVTLNTAKVHVRGVMRKLGVNRRALVAERAREWLQGMESEQYEALSGGLPLNWDAEYRDDDPFAGLYRNAGGGSVEGGDGD